MAEPTEGKKAPLFTALDQDGNKVSLKDFLGKPVVLYFYPKDDTPGCTKQACALRDDWADIKKTGAVVLGVSIDPVASHAKFQAKHKLPFTLISDENKVIVEKYGVWVEKSMYGKKYMGTERSTFIIDEAGKLKKIFRKVQPAKHLKLVLDALAE